MHAIVVSVVPCPLVARDLALPSISREKEKKVSQIIRLRLQEPGRGVFGGTDQGPSVAV